MRTDDDRFLLTALRLQLIDEGQARTVRSELDAFEDQSAPSVLLGRGFLSRGEVAQVREAMTGTNGPEAPAGEAEGSGRTPSDTEWSPLKAAFDAASKRDTAAGLAPPPLSEGDTSTGEIRRLLARGPKKPLPERKLPGPDKPSSLVQPQAAPSEAQPSPPRSRAVLVSEAGDRLEASRARLAQLLARARGEQASDLHISPNRCPFIRRHGRLQYLEDVRPLTAEESGQLCWSPLSPEQREILMNSLQLDVAFELPEIGRQRANLYRQRLGWEGAFRLIPYRTPTIEGLGLPDVLRSLTDYRQGMILVTGPHGSGKTATVAALLDHINRTRADHIITLEDPVEYVIKSQKSHVTQREVGRQTLSFQTGLRAALREDPDVIFVGEMRDAETISIAATAAETGHLVFGTLHTASAARAVTRIIESYPPEQRGQIAAMVSKSVRGVVAQQLIPCKDGEGLALALEIVVFTPAIAMMIQEGKTHQLASAIQSGRRLGMKLMDESLQELARQNVIEAAEAWARAENKEMFQSGRGS